jgi:hypothetical protein
VQPLCIIGSSGSDWTNFSFGAGTVCIPYLCNATHDGLLKVYLWLNMLVLLVFLLLSSNARQGTCSLVMQCWLHIPQEGVYIFQDGWNDLHTIGSRDFCNKATFVSIFISFWWPWALSRGICLFWQSKWQDFGNPSLGGKAIYYCRCQGPKGDTVFRLTLSQTATDHSCNYLAEGSAERTPGLTFYCQGPGILNTSKIGTA